MARRVKLEITVPQRRFLMSAYRAGGKVGVISFALRGKEIGVLFASPEMVPGLSGTDPIYVEVDDHTWVPMRDRLKAIEKEMEMFYAG